MNQTHTALARALGDFDRHGFTVLSGAITSTERRDALRAAQHLLASNLTSGRDRGADGKDGFRGVVALDDAFLRLIANPAVLEPVTALLGTNLHLLSSHLIALPAIPPGAARSIRTAQRPGWHRDMYGVAADLGPSNVPRLAIKAAFYLTDPGPQAGITMFLPGSHQRLDSVTVPAGSIDPPGAVAPDLGPQDAVLFENRTWHAGGLNTGKGPRIALMLQYGYRWLAPVDDPAPALLARDDLSAIERQLLGARDRHQDGSLAKGAGGKALLQWHQDRNLLPAR